jgi:putative flippase GtrA
MENEQELGVKRRGRRPGMFAAHLPRLWDASSRRSCWYRRAEAHLMRSPAVRAWRNVEPSPSPALDLLGAPRFDVGGLWREARRITSFAGVGAVAGVCDYAVMVALRELAGWRAAPAALVGYAIGAVISYTLNRRHTFRSGRPHRQAAWRFAAVNVAGFLLTGMVMHVLSDVMGVNYLGARLITIILVFGLNYAAHRLWTFAPTVRSL